MSKRQTLIEKYKAIQKIGIEVEVPYHVWAVFPNARYNKTVSIMGDEVCLGGDYVTVEGARFAVEWYVQQLGGKVEWVK